MRILSVILLLIAYGSLYPGNFSVPREGALNAFLTNFSVFTSIGDLLGNVALFFPLGIAAVLFSSSRRFDRTHSVATLLWRAFIRSPSSWRKSGYRRARRHSPMYSGIW